MEITPAISATSQTTRTFYQAYLRTPEWRRRRNRALKQAGYTCHKCASKRGLQVHHNTYERLGREWDTDLDVLCEDCHSGHHVETLAQGETTGIYLKLASVALREQPFSTISDLADVVKSQCAKLKIRYDSPTVDRALSLLAGSNRLSSPPPQTQAEVIREQGRPLNAAESRECLRRTGFKVLVKSMPVVTLTPVEQARHEARIQEQIKTEQATQYRAERRTRNVMERLADIFS